MIANTHLTSQIRMTMIAILTLALLLTPRGGAGRSTALKQFQPSAVSVAARGVAGGWSATRALRPDLDDSARAYRAYGTALQPQRWQRVYSSARAQDLQVNWGD